MHPRNVIDETSSHSCGSMAKNIEDSTLELCGDKLLPANVEEISSSSTCGWGLTAKNIDADSSEPSDGEKSLESNNVEETLASVTTQLAGKCIDNSLDILSDSSDAGLVPVPSDDSGRSSCQSNILSSLPAAYLQSPSTSPAAYLTTSNLSAFTVSSSSSFTDLQLNCLSSDGLWSYFLCYLS